jgi:hypothetical protein
MGLVILIVLVVVGVSLATLLHAIRVAPDGEQTELGFQTAVDPVPPAFRKTSRVLKADDSHVSSRTVHAA